MFMWKHDDLFPVCDRKSTKAAKGDPLVWSFQALVSEAGEWRMLLARMAKKPDWLVEFQVYGGDDCEILSCLDLLHGLSVACRYKLQLLILSSANC